MEGFGLVSLLFCFAMLNYAMQCNAYLHDVQLPDLSPLLNLKKTPKEEILMMSFRETRETPQLLLPSKLRDEKGLFLPLKKVSWLSAPSGDKIKKTITFFIFW